MLTEATKSCKGCGAHFEVQRDDVSFYKRVKAPAPNFCPPCRMQRRLLHRNERTLYKRPCDLCKKDGIAIYPSGMPFPVYCAPCWWGDGWDAKSFGRPYDPSRPFFDQWKELQNSVPRIALLSITSVNSEYTNNAEDNKNCYLLFAAGRNEDCLYGRLVYNCRSVVDACFVYESERCYECVDCRQCYNCFFSEQCQTSMDLSFCINVRDSQNCIFSANVRHMTYAIENIPCSKEEYEKRKKEIFASYETIQAAKDRFEELKKKALRKYAFQTKCVNARGDYLFNCHDGKLLFDVRNAKNCAYMADAEDPIDCWDGNNMYSKPELCLDLMGILESSRTKHSTYILYSSGVEYSDNCQNCESCFGCIGLRKTQYCILNTAYTKEEYERLKSEIIAAMQREGVYGDFLPPFLSPFGYSETLANDYFQLSRDAILAKGFNVHDAAGGTFGKETIPKGSMPQTIQEAPEAMVNEILVCETCGKNFRIVAAELDFYRSLNLPLPRKDFACRHKARMEQRTPRTLWCRACACAGNASEGGAYKNTGMHIHGTTHCPREFETSYALNRPEIVYCEACYNAEVA